MTVSSLQHLTVGAPSATSAGAPLSVTVTAQAASDRTVAGYVGTSTSPAQTSGGATLPADYTFVAADAGSRTFTGGLTFRTSGSQTVTASDTVQPALTATQLWP